MKLFADASFPLLLGLACALGARATAQTPYPDLLYYTFDEGAGTTTANLATPGVGTNPALVHGQTLAPGGGQFGGSLVGIGGNASANYVDSGWATQFPGSFTISFWLDLTAVTTANPFMYVFGETTSSFRCFTNGAAGTGGITLRSTPWSTGVIVPGGAASAAPHHVAFVYDHGVPELRGYLDGARVATAPVAAATYSGVGPFRVGGWAGASALAVGAKVDEFRVYSRALTDGEIAATWNVPLAGNQPPVAYCTAGTTTHGCVASIGGTGTPSASAASGFVLAVNGVEGAQQGIIFYGVDNTGFTPLPWGASTSFMCVKSPVERLAPQSAGGTPGACDGVLSVDWNAFIATHPTALGNPFAAGRHVFAQGWFRDPPSPKTTMLSDGLEFVVGP